MATRCLACHPITEAVLPWMEKIAGRSISAVTLGPNLTLVFAKDMTPDEAARLDRHERVHREQAAKFRPVWARGPFAKVKRIKQAGDALAAARFLRYYLKLHMETGYDANPLEAQARAAE